MSRKELPRAGLVQAALAGKITNREGAVARRTGAPRLAQRAVEAVLRLPETGGATRAAPPPLRRC